MNTPTTKTRVSAPAGFPWRRYRFHANEEDSRPVRFPPPGPWWESGFGNGYAIVVAYLPSSETLTDWWPEASAVEFTEEAEILFSSRFERPDWWTGEGRTATENAMRFNSGNPFRDAMANNRGITTNS